MKKIISGVIGTIIMANTLVPISVNAEDVDVVENLIYHTTTTHYVRSDWWISAITTCYSNGHVNIDIVPIRDNSGETIKNMGTVSINTTYVAEIGADGYAGTSKFNNISTTSSYTSSQINDTVTYNLYCSRSWHHMVGTSIVTLDFYVKENYLNTNQEISVFGQIIELPFNVVNPYTTIQELEEENTKLKSENEHLLDMLKSQGNRAYGDMDNNGFVDGRDATILLTYYAKTSVGYVGTLEEFIGSLSN